MTRTSIQCVFISLSLLAALSTFASADFTPAQWQFFSPVTIPTPPAKPAGLVEISLPPEVLDLAAANAYALYVGPAFGGYCFRLIDPSGAEVPYLLARPDESSPTPQWLEAGLTNLSYLPGKSTTVTADFRDSFPKTSIKILTRGSDFRREVLVEASPDGKSFQTIRQGALVFNVKYQGIGYDGGANGNIIAKEGSLDFQRDVVTFPVNDCRYLRLTVFNSPADKDVVEIPYIAARKMPPPAGPSPALLPVDLGPAAVTQDPKNHSTTIEFDRRYHNPPLNMVSFDFTESNFFRRAVFEGRNTTSTVVKFRREDNSPAEKTVETPWTTYRSFVLFRYSSGSAPTDSNLSVSLQGITPRYIRLTVYNGDDAPLTFVTAKADGFATLLRYAYRPDQTVRLFFGNPNASVPVYDLSHFANRLQTEGVISASLSPYVPNPDYIASSPQLPWSERHRWIIGLALLVAGLALAFIIYRQVRSIKEPPGTDTSESAQ